MFSPRIPRPLSVEEQKAAAWLKSTPIPGWPETVWRRDIYGSVIRHSDHGNRSSEYGWEVDHIIPVARGGLTIASNLQALHWRNNSRKSDKLPLAAFLARPKG